MIKPPLSMNLVYCMAALGVALTGMFAKEKKLQYPVAPQSEQVDDYHGTKVADPYRKLEDPDAAETKAWVEAENKVTTEFLQGVPARGPLLERLKKLWDYVRYGTPSVRGGRYFYTRNDGLQNQSVLCVADSLQAEPRVLLDPNKLSPDGTTSLAGYSLSDDGSLLAYGLAAAGSDWNEWRVRDVATGQDRDDHLKWIKFSGTSWSTDGAGFYYSRYDEPAPGAELTGTNYFQKLYYHRLGTKQSDDRLIYERKDEKEWGFDGSATDDGRYLVVTVWRGTEHKNRVFIRDLTVADGPFVELTSGFDAE